MNALRRLFTYDEETLAGKAVLTVIFLGIVGFVLACGTIWMVPA